MFIIDILYSELSVEEHLQLIGEVLIESIARRNAKQKISYVFLTVH